MDQPSFKKTMPPTNVALPRKSRKRLPREEADTYSYLIMRVLAVLGNFFAVSDLESSY
jgi:hypothetical protein